MQQINNLQPKLSNNQEQIKAAINRVLTSGWLVLGPEVGRFEASFADYIGAGHCISLANGTDAIELALKAMGIGPGDLVATVANAGMYTTIALLAIGAKPFFMDVDPETRCTTLQEVERALESGVKGVVVTHLYGLALPEIEAIAALCSLKNVPLLEDCAQSHGARINGKRAGSFGDAASFSFYPTKNLGALGDGGAVVTNDQELAKRVQLLRQYGWTKKYEVSFSGARNSRLDEMQAAILSEFLPELDTANTRRREIAARYSAEIHHRDLVLPKIYGLEYVAHLYVIQSKRRDALREHLRSCEIASDVHYPIPDHKQPVFGANYSNISLPVTEKLTDEILTLPCYPELTEKEVDNVIAAVNGWPA